MRAIESPLLFAGRVVVVCTLLMAVGTLVREPYGAMYRALANGFAGSLGLGSNVVVRRLDPPVGTLDTSVVLFDMDSGRFARRSLSPWRQGYLPTAVAVGLVLATSIPLRRRWGCVFATVLILQAFVALRFGTVLLNGLNGPHPWCVMNLGGFWSGVFRDMETLFVNTTTFAYAVSAIVFIAVVRPHARNPDAGE